MQEINSTQFKRDIVKNKSLITGHLFAYKSPYKIGEVYVNKDSFVELGAVYLSNLLRSSVNSAFSNGFKFKNSTKKVVVLGNAYGSIGYAITIAEALEMKDTHLIAMPLRTELDREDDKKHVIPSKLMSFFEDADEILIVEDIANNFETAELVVKLIREKISKDIPIHMICLFDRGIKNDQKAIDIGLQGFYPFLQEELPEYDIRTSEGLNFLNSSLEKGMKFHPNLGKTKDFIKDFGEKSSYTKEDIAAVQL